MPLNITTFGFYYYYCHYYFYYFIIINRSISYCGGSSSGGGSSFLEVHFVLSVIGLLAVDAAHKNKELLLLLLTILSV
jgi:hypothetical protein